MKSIYFLAGPLLAAFLLTACGGQAPAGEQAATGDAMAAGAATGMPYAVDVNASVINWEGSKLVGGKHTGTLKLQKGEILVADGQITGGAFVIDINSINNTDQKAGDGKEDLEAHLKDGDFFEANTYPTAEFVIVKVEPVSSNPNATHNITGNLTMKGITKSVVIPARVSAGETGLQAITPAFTIDRTQWNVMFQAGVLGTAKDEIINDQIGLQINLSATPK